MTFNSFQERGIPAEKQLRSWSELNVKPYDKNEVHPYTRAWIILMNGVEVEGAISSSPATAPTRSSRSSLP